MKRLIFQEFLSLDGYAADRNNTTKFFEDKRFYSRESDEDLLRGMDDFDTILLGANTYKLFVDFWPQATVDEEIVADRLNSIPKIVFSSSLAKAPWGKWPEAAIIKTDAVEAVKELKAGSGKNMVLWGSISLARALMQHNLIDEYHLRIVPVLLGDGRSLFEKMEGLNLELLRSKSYPTGLVLLEYKKSS